MPWITRENGRYVINTDGASVSDGCVEDIVIEDNYEWCWEFTPLFGNMDLTRCVDKPLLAREGAKLVGVRITPQDKVSWAGEYYEQPMSVTLSGPGPWVIVFKE